jgi:signal transduction histidine kinase
LTTRVDEGNPTSGIGITQDITERKWAEKELKKYQERLKALASQLTLAEEKERSRIAAELHDHIGQTLAFSRIQVAKAKKYAPEGKLAAILDEISRSLLGTIQDTRELIFDLSSPLLNEFGLAAAISNWLEEQVSAKHGIKVELVGHDEDLPLGKDVKSILFRNVRELLTNVVKHSRAAKASVSLERNGSELKIAVRDDGVGCDAARMPPHGGAGSGFGLFSVRERMEDYGGNLEVISAPGKGCSAIMTMPLK